MITKSVMPDLDNLIDSGQAKLQVGECGVEARRFT